MKTILQKSLILVTLALFGLQVQGQCTGEIAPATAEDDGYGLFCTNAPGTWKIRVKDEVSGAKLFLTVNNDLEAVWTTEINPGGDDDPSQLWNITEYEDGSAEFFIKTAIPVLDGQVLMADLDSASAESDVTPNLIVGTANGQDKWSMRKQAGVEADYSANGDLPGQNSIFLVSDNAGTNWAAANNAVRIGNNPVDGNQIQLDQSATGLRFKLIAPILSTEDFDTSSVVISNPVKNELNIQGLTADVQQVSVYSLLGKQILSSDVNTQSTLSLDVSDLATGMYLVKFQGDRSFFTKKFIKQ